MCICICARKQFPGMLMEGGTGSKAPQHGHHHKARTPATPKVADHVQLHLCYVFMGTSKAIGLTLCLKSLVSVTLIFNLLAISGPFSRLKNQFLFFLHCLIFPPSFSLKFP